MKARTAYRLVTSGGRGPAFLAPPDRLDRVEVVEIDSGEAVLLWDLPPREAARLARALREDLNRLEADDFLAAWQAAGDLGGDAGD
jgi:hypothetical protein